MLVSFLRSCEHPGTSSLTYLLWRLQVRSVLRPPKAPTLEHWSSSWQAAAQHPKVKEVRPPAHHSTGDPKRNSSNPSCPPMLHLGRVIRHAHTPKEKYNPQRNLRRQLLSPPCTTQLSERRMRLQRSFSVVPVALSRSAADCRTETLVQETVCI